MSYAMPAWPGGGYVYYPHNIVQSRTYPEDELTWNAVKKVHQLDLDQQEKTRLDPNAGRDPKPDSPFASMGSFVKDITERHYRELMLKDDEIRALRMQILLLQKQVDEQNSLLMFMQGEMHGR